MDFVIVTTHLATNPPPPEKIFLTVSRAIKKSCPRKCTVSLRIDPGCGRSHLDDIEEKSSTPTVWNMVGAERTSRHNVTEITLY
jgi:hypothetical protein